MLKALISYFFFTFSLTCSAQVSENSFIHCVVLGPVKLRNDIQWVEITKLNCKKIFFEYADFGWKYIYSTQAIITYIP